LDSLSGLLIPVLFTIVLTFSYVAHASSVTELSEPIYQATSTVASVEQKFHSATTTQISGIGVISYNEYITQQILKTFPDAPIMVHVAQCESGLDPTADRSGLGVDVGLFQINQVHLPELSKLGLVRTNLQDNLKFARILYNQSGLKPWYKSKPCWGKYM
jgi:hypothetical protein